jgi:hypothetical protein
MHVAIWTGFVALAALSVLSAALLPFHDGQPWVYTIPGVIFALSGIVTTVIRRRYARRLALFASTE